ncbi:hypothetical protein ACG02S_25400 [Roseateles sp. DC23W]|uniref:Uncharacterized protein n=1 Tax=Pelomonas dachongensis TaxID=3299029 RepID=A0ABW7EWN5_9BURK
MSFDLRLSEGTGTLHPAIYVGAVPNDEPILSGLIHFDVTERWHASLLRVRADAWLDISGARLRYRVSVGGITGWMSHRMRIAGVGPNYVGVLGPHRELQIAGWRNRVQAAESPSVTLMIYSSELGSHLLERLLARSLGSQG